jgi:CheY-like chemotaxis protein
MKSSKPRVLIIEDEKIIALDIRKLLEKMGCEVISIIDNGEDAVEAAGDKKPDLILMDIILKDYMSGIEAANIIYQKYKIPIIYLTALTDDETFLNSRELYPFYFLNKPFEEKELSDAVQSTLNNN